MTLHAILQSDIERSTGDATIHVLVGSHPLVTGDGHTELVDMSLATGVGIIVPGTDDLHLAPIDIPPDSIGDGECLVQTGLAGSDRTPDLGTLRTHTIESR